MPINNFESLGAALRSITASMAQAQKSGQASTPRSQGPKPNQEDASVERMLSLAAIPSDKMDMARKLLNQYKTTGDPAIFSKLIHLGIPSSDLLTYRNGAVNKPTSIFTGE